MGCKFCKVKMPSAPGQGEIKSESQVSANKEYSWDKKERPNAQDYTIEGVRGMTVGRLPGSVNGQQLILQNCEDSSVYIFDHVNTFNIDDCNKCIIVLGPTKGSVFLRNCHDCRCVVACQQFRLRDCKNLEVYLCCTTQPIIEASSSIKFGCYQFSYRELEGLFHEAGLSVFNNNWSNVHDFTPVDGGSNWALLSPDIKIADRVPLPTTSELTSVHASFDPSDSLVPFTYGTTYKSSEESSIVVFFSDGHAQRRALSFIQDMTSNYRDIKLISTKEVKMLAGDVKRVLGTDAYSLVVEHGNVIGLEYNGPGSIQACQKTAMEIGKATGSTGLVYISTNSKTANRQVEDFFGFADMQMSG